MPKVDLITGFLGAGKTTFLLRYARYLMGQGERLCILEYDYGAVNTDMLLLKELRGDRCELEMLAAGCDRDCLNRRFRTKLISMAMSGYDRVIIEPSGVFDMDLFYDSLREPPLDNWYETGSVIAVVSAGLGSETLTPEEEFILASQASCAGCVLFSRVQQLPPEAVSAAQRRLEESAEHIGCRSFSPVYIAKNWQALTDGDFAQIASCGYHLADYTKTIAGQESDFGSVSILEPKAELKVLLERIGVLFADPSYGEISRVKGFVKGGGETWQINATPRETRTSPCDTVKTVLTVIGKDLNQEEILRLLNQ